MWHATPTHLAALRRQPRDDTGLVWLLTGSGSATRLREAIIRPGCGWQEPARREERRRAH